MWYSVIWSFRASSAEYTAFTSNPSFRRLNSGFLKYSGHHPQQYPLRHYIQAICSKISKLFRSVSTVFQHPCLDIETMSQQCCCNDHLFFPFCESTGSVSIHTESGLGDSSVFPKRLKPVRRCRPLQHHVPISCRKMLYFQHWWRIAISHHIEQDIKHSFQFQLLDYLWSSESQSRSITWWAIPSA